MTLKLRTIVGLNAACCAVDAIAYRPLVIHVTRRLPRWWSCELARLSMRLDTHWGTAYWAGESAPAAPHGLCDACHRRAAWLVVGGEPYFEADAVDLDDYMTSHPVRLCGWCRLDLGDEERDADSLRRGLDRAGAASVGWRWS
jgi:hypothetical protein